MGAFTMPSSRSLFLLVALASGVAALAQTPPAYNLGRTPTREEIQAWDIAISPDGKELPPGKGTAKQGAAVYAQQCAACHGPTGAEQGQSDFPLVGGTGTLTTLHPVRTLGSFWAFATTIWDYIRRGMPPGEEGSLSADQVYAVTAYLLYRNGIIQENDVLDAKSLPKIQMPNRKGFVPAKPEWKPREKRPFGFYP